MTLKRDNYASYLDDWPDHYFEISPVAKKREVLLDRLEEFNDPGDRRRMELLDLRYDKKGYDMFLRGLVNLAIVRPNPGFLTRKSEAQLVQECIDDLHLREEPDEYMLAEYDDVCRFLIRLDFEDKRFTTGTLNIRKLDENALASKIAAQVDKITRVIPQAFGVSEYFTVIRPIMTKAYQEMLVNGPELWKNYLESHT